MMPELKSDQAERLRELYRDMEPQHLMPLWEQLAELVPRVPKSAAICHRWTYAEVRGFLMRAGEMITAQQAERRVLILENPGLRGTAAITPSLYAGLQLILPGEIAPCHRHSQCALRFVLEGAGAYTALDGEKAVMQPFDLVLTPAGQWHDHGNDTSLPMIWLDGLDIPTVRHFEAGFSEMLPNRSHPETVPPGDTMVRYGHNMRPFRGSTADRRPARQLNLGGVAGGIVLGQLIDRRNPYLILGAAYAGAAVCIAALAISGSSVLLLLTFSTLAGVGICGAQIGLNALTAARYPTEIRATAIAPEAVGSALQPPR